MRRSTQIITACASFLIGIIFAANFVVIVYPIMYLVIIVTSAVCIYFFKSKLGYLLLIVIGLLLGIWRYNYFITHQLPSALMHENQKVSVVGTIEGEPRWDEYRNYVFYLKEASISGQKVEGLVRIKTIAGFAKEGQIVKASGKLKAGLGKAESLISYAQVDVIHQNQPIMIQIKQAFLQGLDTTLPKEAAAFMAGILIGSRSGLSKDSQNVLTLLGLSHIVAVSGYNLTILVGFLQRRFTKNWRWGGLIGSLWIILGFVIIAGASASIMRAGIMSALFLLANYYGKRLNLVVCMALVAVGMVGLQPASLLSDIGWQLSFLSLFGITLLAPKISRVLPAKPAILNDILSVTLAAQLATAGLVAYTFGQISLVAPLSNLLIMPFIPILMLLGFVASLAGIIIPNSAYMIIGRPINWIVLLQFDLFKYLASWKFSNVQLKNIPLQAISIYYLAVIVSMLVIRADNKTLSELENDDTIEVEAGLVKTHQLHTLSKETTL